jgi:CrcB protein
MALAWVGMALVGGLGALARFWLDGAVSRRVGGVFPAGTLAVNLTGSFALGVLVGAGVEGDALLVAGTGLVGAYTTFSTWMLETHRLGEDGRWRALAANVVLSLALGLAAVALGRALA